MKNYPHNHSRNDYNYTTPETQPQPLTIQNLLITIQQRFYSNHPPHTFYRDKQMLTRALLEPSLWLNEHQFFCSQQRYQQLLENILNRIQIHGDPTTYNAFFPAYLLKTIQRWLKLNSETLYYELRHIRNNMDSILSAISQQQRDQALAQRNQIDTLAQAHALLLSLAKSRKKHPSHPTALTNQSTPHPSPHPANHKKIPIQLSLPI